MKRVITLFFIVLTLTSCNINQEKKTEKITSPEYEVVCELKRSDFKEDGEGNLIADVENKTDRAIINLMVRERYFDKNGVMIYSNENFFISNWKPGELFEWNLYGYENDENIKDFDRLEISAEIK